MHNMVVGFDSLVEDRILNRRITQEQNKLNAIQDKNFIQSEIDIKAAKDKAEQAILEQSAQKEKMPLDPCRALETEPS